ncbi:MAG: tandem-95 repeat protein [Archangiaceae bacterium]|nr:tandem-95 repeat protein [Archangiaceae bacterium]
MSLLAAGAVGLAVKAPQPSKASPSTGEALTLAEVMRRTHFAFRESPQGFTGAHTTYTSRVEAGRVELSAASAEAEPLRLGATEVRRGDALLSKARAAWRRNPDGTVSAALGELEEQLENGPEGLEQRWRFERAPAGRGPLEVRVAARAEYQGSDAQGLRLAVGALAYRYSHATWVDATGARTAVPARWADGAIALTVPAEVLDASAWPAVLDPLVSAEIALDPPTVVAAPGNQDTAAIAWNGSQYLAVWVDGRGPGGAARDIYGTRLNAAGAPLDPYGILIAISTASAAAPAVASNGTDFMVVFTQDNGQNARVNAARVTAAGVALDTVGATIADPGPDTSAELPAIAWSGTSYLVVWGQYDVASTTATTVEGVRIDQNHTPLGAPFNIGLAGGGVAQTPDVDWDGSNYLVVWRQTGTLAGLYARRVSAAGVPAASSFAVSSTGNPLVPSVAWNGATHLVVWQNGATGTGDIYGARVPATGSTVTDPSGFVISNATGAQDAPDVTAAGSTFYVAWHDTRGGGAADIYGAQVSGTTVTPAAGTAISAAASNQLWVALGSDGSNVMSVWSDYRNAGTSDLYGTLINAAGAVQTPAGTRLSTAGNTELTPAVAFDGTNYLVVWEDQRGAASDVYGVRVSPAGVPLDATAIAISTAANNQKAPAVAWAGSNYLVVWQDDRTALGVFDVYAARVSAAGAVLDATGVPVSAAANNQQAPAVAYDGTNALVVWEDDRTTAGTFHIFGARVSGAGAVLDAAGVAISQGARAERRPAIGWNGATYFVAYENMNLSSQWDITGRIVSSSVVAAAARTYAAASALNFRYHPALGASGATFLLAWEALSGSDIDVVGMRVDGAGNGVLTIQLGTGPQAQSYPAVAGDGTNFQVVWQDATNGATNRDLYGRRVSAATGALLDASPFVVSNGSTDELAPALASSGSRAFLVAYQAFAVGPNAARARARTLANAPPTATPTSASVAEDGVLTPLVLTGTDADADTLSFAIVSPPTHGTLSGAAPSVTYTPALNYAGPDSFTFKVNDGVVDSAPGTVSLTVTPVNDLPVPAGQAASVQEDTPKAITLTGSDVEGSPLTFAVVNPPTHGSLSGSAPNLTYSPAPDYNGPDSFTFKVNDGTADSAGLATVTITVVAVNDAPTAIAQNTNTPEDTAKAITLNGTDVEGSALTYQIVAQPPFGTLSGTPPNLTYTPNLNFNGTDSFQFTVNDGALTSAPAQVNVLVQPVNDAPLAQGQAVGTPQDTAVSVTLVGTDVDNNPLTYVIVAQPMHGTLSAGTSATRTYTPTPGYQGGDSFTFKVNDGTVDSNVATVTVSVSSVNHAPTASAQGVTTPEDQSVAITLTGADSDGDPLNYTVTVPPLHGSLTGSGSARTYTPTLNYNGPDSFTFRVNDGQVDSPPAVVSITVSPVNDAPTAAGQNVSTQEDTPLAVTLTGADLDGNPLTFAVVLQPMHGALSGTPPNLTYTPAANYNGFDVFSFKANDGTVDSAAAANVQIVVATVNDAPVAQAQMVMTNQTRRRSSR